METENQGAEAGATELETATAALAPTDGGADKAELEEGEARFIGSFASYQEVREFVAEEGGKLRKGDVTVVNDSLCRVMPSGALASIVNVLDEYGDPADHTEAFARAMTDIERAVLGASFESGPLLGNFVNVIVTMFKSRPKQWSQMSAGEQRDLIKALEGHCKTLLRRVARVVAEGEEISIAAKLERYTHSGSFDIKITAAGDDEETALQLFRMQGHDIVILSADAKRFLDSVGAEDQVEEDQREMPLEPADNVEEVGAAQEPAPGDDALDSAADEVVAEQQAEAVPIGAAFETSEAKRLADAKAADAENRKPGKKTKADKGGVETAPAEPETVEIPAAEGGDEADAKPDADGAAPGEYESRTNPDDAPATEDTPFEADAEELAAQKGRPTAEEAKPKADYVGVKKPSEAVPGETWLNTEDDRVRHLHPNMSWYLTAPTAEALEEYNANPPTPVASDESGFPATPDA